MQQLRKKLNEHDKFCPACGSKVHGSGESSELDIELEQAVQLRGIKSDFTIISVYIPQHRKNISLKIPNEIEVGQKVRVRGLGLTNEQGKTGDLLVAISDITYYDAELMVSVLLSGADSDTSRVPIYLPYAHKTVQVSIPNTTSEDQILRLKGMGLQSADGENGDLYLHFDHIERVNNTDTPEQSASAEEDTGRKTVYDGMIHKCPNCGELLNTFVAVCPTCGYELRNVKITSCVNELAMKLEQVKDSVQKDELIRNFYIPNTKEDICDFLILAVSNIKADDVCEDAWRAKLEQAYQKAKLSFSKDPAFEEMRKLYLSASKAVNAGKFVRRILRNKYSIPAIILIVSVIMQIIGQIGLGANLASLSGIYLLGDSLLPAAPVIALGMLIYDLVNKHKENPKR